MLLSKHCGRVMKTRRLVDFYRIPIDENATRVWAIEARKKFEKANNPAFRTKEESAVLRKREQPIDPETTLLPRESGHDIGMGSPVPLSDEAVGVITRLRNQKVRCV